NINHFKRRLIPSQSGRLTHSHVVRYIAITPGQFSTGTDGQFSTGSNTPSSICLLPIIFPIENRGEILGFELKVNEKFA
ncbi:MAG: hypothetical protein NTW90_08210, partial [Nitrosospira sp.]|nr:hypothetical protein [Nitrosospira sp.]